MYWKLKIVAFILIIYPINTLNAQLTSDSLFQSAGFHIINGQFEQAKELYTSLINENPVNSETAAKAQYLLATVYEFIKDYENAGNEYLKVKQNHPDIQTWVDESLYSLANCYYKEAIATADSGKLDISLARFSRFIETYPTNKKAPQALILLAITYTEKGYWDNSIDILNKIISFDENLVSNVTSEERNEWIKQVKDLKENAKYSRGTILQNELQRYNEALADFEEILQINSERKDVELSKALTLLQTQRKKEAMALLKKLSAEEGPEGDAAEYYLSQLKDTEGN